jgi:hypothetical protein
MDAIDYAESAGSLFALGAFICCGFFGLFFIALAAGPVQEQAGES